MTKTLAGPTRSTTTAVAERASASKRGSAARAGRAPAADGSRVSRGTASPHARARARGAGAENREEVSSAGPGAGGAPGSGGEDARLEQRRQARDDARGDGADYGDSLRRPTGAAGVDGGTAYPGGSLH